MYPDWPAICDFSFFLNPKTKGINFPQTTMVFGENVVMSKLQAETVFRGLFRSEAEKILGNATAAEGAQRHHPKKAKRPSLINDMQSETGADLSWETVLNEYLNTAYGGSTEDPLEF